jgi:hypothetical protein
VRFVAVATMAILADRIAPAPRRTIRLPTSTKLDRDADTILPVVREPWREIDLVLQKRAPARCRLDRQCAAEMPRQPPAITQRRY